MINIDALALVAAVIIAIIGWIVSLVLQSKNIRDQHKIEIRYDIYKQFVALRKSFQNSIIKLGTHTNPPFIMMRSCMIQWELKLKKDFDGIQIPWSEQECVFEGQKIWNAYVQELYQLYFEFSEQNREMLSLFEDWMSPLTSLQAVMSCMQKEIGEQTAKIHERLDVLQMYQSNNGHDWRSWDEKEVRKISDEIQEYTNEIGSYSHDFTVLVHNELLSLFFKGKRPTRKTLDPKYKVLTKKGVVESLDYAKIEEMRVATEAIILDARIQLESLSTEDEPLLNKQRNELESIAKGSCQICKYSIQVVGTDESKTKATFRYICGHKWEQSLNN